MTILRTTSATTIREPSLHTHEKSRLDHSTTTTNMCNRQIEENNEEEEVEECGMTDAMFQRGAYLRMLRQLELEDEAERQQQQTATFQPDKQNEDNDVKKSKDCDDTASLSHASSSSSLSIASGDDIEDQIDVVVSSEGLKYKVLEYASFLGHQRYYDDLKHANVNFINYGQILDSNGCAGGQLIIEQRKSLGKGGLCWDAAFILAEYMIAHEKQWNVQPQRADCAPVLSHDYTPPQQHQPPPPTKVVELGSGTGLGGLMIAKAVANCHVTITDLPELVDLMTSNVALNFKQQQQQISLTNEQQNIFQNDTNSKSNATAQTLRWGVKEDYTDGPYDVIFGADVVTSLYDPIALAHTLYDLSHETTKVYVSVKARLSEPHELFEGEMKRLFEKVEIIWNVEESRNRNPDTAIIVAEGLKR
mmetsp:Transcript_15615/g.23062  ORF Transcript_15615/g.23062 Transcript_15615/m.23062 type:complete len:419 (+) Transcript_15615:96-1352(+)